MIGPPWLAHVATAEGLYVAELLCDLTPTKIDYNSIPNCTYCKPEVASIGSTEESLLEQFTDNWYDLATAISASNAILKEMKGTPKTVAMYHHSIHGFAH